MIKVDSAKETRSSTKSQSLLLNVGSINESQINPQPKDHTHLQKSITMDPKKSFRKDIFGHEIKRGGKAHKVTFIDKVANSEDENIMVEIVPVENYKSYNATMVYPERPYHRGSEIVCCETCLII